MRTDMAVITIMVGLSTGWVLQVHASEKHAGNNCNVSVLSKRPLQEATDAQSVGEKSSEEKSGVDLANQQHILKMHFLSKRPY